MLIRKVILMLALGLICSSAMAEWTEVLKSANGKVVAYADLSTLRKKDNLAKMWNLYDLSSAQGDGAGKTYLSVKSQQEYNCEDETSRLLAISQHSENMGNGDIVFSDYSLLGKWEAIAPNSLDEALWKYACNNITH